MLFGPGQVSKVFPYGGHLIRFTLCSRLVRKGLIAGLIARFSLSIVIPPCTAPVHLPDDHPTLLSCKQPRLARPVKSNVTNIVKTPVMLEENYIRRFSQ